MKYQCQVRTILYSGNWSEWTNVANPMTEGDKRRFLYLQSLLVPATPSEFRFIEIPDDSPSVFMRRQAD